MAPMVHGLEARYYGRITFAFLDADDPATFEFQRTLGFVYQPEFYLLDGLGNLVQKWIGRVSEDQFVAAFNALLGE
jgi:hypothetical protein